MTKYYSNTLRIISIITLIAFVSTQAAFGYEGRPASTQPQKSHLRAQQFIDRDGSADTVPDTKPDPPPKGEAAGGAATAPHNIYVLLERNVNGRDDVQFWRRPIRVCLQLEVRGLRIIQLAFYSSMLSLFLGGYTKKPTAPRPAAKRPDSSLTAGANLMNTSEPKAAAITIRDAFIKVLPKIFRLADVYIAISRERITQS